MGKGSRAHQDTFPGGLPTASWEEARGAHQSGRGLEVESSQPRLIAPSVHPSHNIQTILGQALRGPGHQPLIVSTIVTPQLPVLTARLARGWT